MEYLVGKRVEMNTNTKEQTVKFHTKLIFIANEDVDKKTFTQNVY